MLVGLGLLGSAALAYHNTFTVPFLFDDHPSIAHNLTIRSLGTAWAPPAEGGLTVSGRPLLNFTLALNYAVSGNAVWSYHLFNLLIHVAAGCTLFGIVRRTLFLLAGERRLPSASGRERATEAGSAVPPYKTDATWLALAVALLWTLHPLQTASVTYIIQRAESLAGLMQLLALWGFIRSTEAGASRFWAWSTWGVCLLGMAAKEVMVTAPVLIVLYDRIFVAGSWEEVWQRRRGQHLALAATWLVLIWLVLGTGGRGGTAGFDGGVAPWAYALTQIGAVGHYLRLALWPQPLIFDYGNEIAQGWGDVWLSALMILPLLGASLWAAWRGRAAGFIGVCFFVLLAPSSSIVPVVTQTMSEHRMYLPLAAVVTLVVFGLHAWWGRRSLPVFGVLALVLGVTTVRRNHDYRTEQAIWEDTVIKRPDNPRALTTLGSLHEKAEQLELALPLLQRAVSIDPNYVEAQNNLALVWVKSGRFDLAAECYRRALVTDPAQPAVWNNLGNALAETGRLAEATEALERALALEPDEAATRSYLATVLARQGRFVEAAAHYGRYLQTRPTDAEAHGNYGSVLLALGRPAEALVTFETAARLQPADARLRHQFGLLLAQSGRLDEALVQFEETVRLDPDFPGARQNAEQAARLLRGR